MTGGAPLPASAGRGPAAATPGPLADSPQAPTNSPRRSKLRARRPTRAEVAAARNRRVADVIADGLDVLFCGINPGLYSGAVGHHFARPGNRFWAALHGSGFTDRKLSPDEETLLLERGLGITNLVPRATATADEVGPEELRRGARALVRKARRRRPRVVALLGLGAFRVAFDSPGATVGPQAEVIGGARAWLLPNPSGLNAHYRIEDLARAFAALRAEVEGGAIPSD